VFVVVLAFGVVAAAAFAPIVVVGVKLVVLVVVVVVVVGVISAVVLASVIVVGVKLAVLVVAVVVVLSGKAIELVASLVLVKADVLGNRVFKVVDNGIIDVVVTMLVEMVGFIVA